MHSRKHNKITIKVTNKVDNFKIDKECNCYNKITTLENKIEDLQQIIKDLQLKSNTSNRKDLKKERLNIDNNDILEMLKYRDHRSVIDLFRNQYLNNYIEYPIRCTGQRKYKYWNNNEWCDDLDGRNIIDIICYNAQQLFLRVNNINSPKIDQNIFIDNQLFILKLSNYKYQRDILKYIRVEISKPLL